MMCGQGAHSDRFLALALGSNMGEVAILRRQAGAKETGRFTIAAQGRFEPGM
jgi:hypothetical protein